MKSAEFHSVSKSEKERIKKEIRSIASESGEVGLLYLFGSFLKRRYFRDIDLAVVLLKEKKPFELFRLESRLKRKIDRIGNYEFDLRVINKAPSEFAFDVLKNGVLLFKRSEKDRVMFESRVIRSYLDFRPFSERLDRRWLHAE